MDIIERCWGEIVEGSRRFDWESIGIRAGWEDDGVIVSRADKRIPKQRRGAVSITLGSRQLSVNGRKVCRCRPNKCVCGDPRHDDWVLVVVIVANTECDLLGGVFGRSPWVVFVNEPKLHSSTLLSGPNEFVICFKCNV